METKLIQLGQRIAELEALAEEVDTLAKKQSKGGNVQPDLSIKGQKWYRGARELLVQQKFSGLDEFDDCYMHYVVRGLATMKRRTFSDIEQYIGKNTSEKNTFTSPAQAKEHYELFVQLFQKARALLLSMVDELGSRELPVRSQLSLAVSADEFETAENLIAASREEPILRASGVIARVALERHLFTVAESRSVVIQINPPNKRKADVEDLLTSLVKHQVLTAIQKSELGSLFKIGNNCAHPKEAVRPDDVERLVRRGKELASMIL